MSYPFSMVAVVSNFHTSVSFIIVLAFKRKENVKLFGVTLITYKSNILNVHGTLSHSSPQPPRQPYDRHNHVSVNESLLPFHAHRRYPRGPSPSPQYLFLCGMENVGVVSVLQLCRLQPPSLASCNLWRRLSMANLGSGALWVMAKPLDSKREKC